MTQTSALRQALLWVFCLIVLGTRVTQATPELLDLAAAILQPGTGERPSALVLADGEHFSAQLVDDLRRRHGFNMLVPMPNRAALRRNTASGSVCSLAHVKQIGALPVSR